ncbi:MAG TPA: hypothetical protein VHB79_14835 [Polyangiaceae bacterium]|nr:hypothetical protein [Polyangiaceae bacterium]
MQQPASPKKLKFPPWLFGALIVPFGLFMIGRGIMKQNSVEVGGQCSNRDECKAPADSCLSVDGRSFCSMFCADSCPNGTKCMAIDLSTNTGVGMTNLPNSKVCLPADLAK